MWSKTLGDNTYVIDLIVALMCTGASIIYSGILGDVSKELLSTVGALDEEARSDDDVKSAVVNNAFVNYSYQPSSIQASKPTGARTS